MKYDITSIEAKGLLIIKPVGFWTVKDFKAYEHDLLLAIKRLNRGSFDLITDMSERITQSIEVSALFEELASRLQKVGLRHFIIVGATPLLRLQARRVTAVATPRLSATMQEALEWLDHATQAR